jgi:hypothetical protein
VGAEGRKGAERMNKAIWEEAARGWDAGRLAGIFVGTQLIGDRFELIPD